MMTDSIAEMLSNGDKESLDRYWFASLPSVRSSYYVRNGELYVDVDDPVSTPFQRHRTLVRVLTYHPAPVHRS